MEQILVFGGTGSLGKQLAHEFSPHLTIVSRDESKQWFMRKQFPECTYIIGDIRDSERVRLIVRTTRPTRIIICAAMKHIDRCEYNVRESYLTNCFGAMNVVNAVEEFPDGIRSVLYISTDKACEPVNTYGATKFLAEKVILEAAKRNPAWIRFMCVRYGNVLNSRGSIIPTLHHTQGNYYITSPKMTRFIMTQNEAVELIKSALLSGETGEIFIPKLRGMKIIELIECFAEKYGREITQGRIRDGEKIHETLISESEQRRVKAGEECFVICAPWNIPSSVTPCNKYDSTSSLLTKSELKAYLNSLQLL